MYKFIILHVFDHLMIDYVLFTSTPCECVLSQIEVVGVEIIEEKCLSERGKKKDAKGLFEVF